MYLIFKISFQIFCTSTAIIFNSLLFYLILYKSPIEFGVYKYLMIFITISEVINSIIDLVVDPIIHSHYASFVVLRNIENSIFTRNQSHVLNSLYCGFFGLSISLFGVHFIYRYASINRDFYDKYLSGKKVYILFFIPIVYGLAWTINCIFCYYPDKQSDDYIREEIKESYDLYINNTIYLSVIFHHSDENGVTHPNYPQFAAIGFLCFIVGSSMFCVFFFGINCYLNIHKSLKSTAYVSEFARSLQRQLFKALVIQTTIPMILMFIPVVLLFIAPMLNYELPFTINFITYTIAIYPAIDPLPNFFLIHSFRVAISQSKLIKFFSKNNRTLTVQYTRSSTNL